MFYLALIMLYGVGMVGMIAGADSETKSMGKGFVFWAIIIAIALGIIHIAFGGGSV
jgi:hypothetical protein